MLCRMFEKRSQSMMMVVTFDMVRTDQFPIESVKIDVVMHNSLTIKLLASEKIVNTKCKASYDLASLMYWK